MPGLDDTLANIGDMFEQQNKRKQEKTKSVISRYTKNSVDKENIDQDSDRPETINDQNENKELEDKLKSEETEDKTSSLPPLKNDGYRTSFILKYKYEDIFLKFRKIFRRQHRVTITKTDLIEIGFLFIKHKLTDEMMKEMTEQKDFESDIVEAFRKVIEEE